MAGSPAPALPAAAQPSGDDAQMEDKLIAWKRFLYTMQRREFDRSVTAGRALLDLGLTPRDVLRLVDQAGRPGRIEGIFARRPVRPGDDSLDRIVREIERMYDTAREPFLSDARALLAALRAERFDDAAGPAAVLAQAIRDGQIGRVEFAQIGEQAGSFGIFGQLLERGASRGAQSIAGPDLVYLASAFELGRQIDSSVVSSFLHFVTTDQDDLADAAARTLLSRNLDAEDFIDIVRESGKETTFPEAITRSRRSPIPALRESAERLDFLRETGFRVRARRPDEIERNIGLLAGTGRQRIVATERLLVAGEYALPRLLETYSRSPDALLRTQSRQVIAQMPRQAALPLALTLRDSPADQQILLVGLLREFRTNIWTPFVHELMSSTPDAKVREACERALADRFGPAGLAGDVAQSFFQLAEGYYKEGLDFTSFVDEPMQLFWSFDPSGRLFAQAIRTEVYHEAVAMALAERSLNARSDSNPALSLWLAANFSREIDSLPDYRNPVYPPTNPSASYFAQAFGHEHSQWTLGLAIDTRDTQLALRAIDAIRATAGSVAMRTPIVFRGTSDAVERRPLLEALSYSNRRVQYEAAVAIAASQPDTDFDGAERVVPLLASAIRDSGKRIVAIISTDAERQGALREYFTSQGWVAIGAPSLADLAPAIETSPGIDLVVVETPIEQIRETIRNVRENRRLGATPVFAMGEGVAFERLVGPLDRDPSIMVRRNDLDETRFAAAVELLLETASGGLIDPVDAARLADASLEQLRTLAISGNTVLDVSDASLAMIAALDELSGGNAQQIRRRERVAEILSRIDDPRAQRALVDAALLAASSAPAAPRGMAEDRWDPRTRHAVALIQASAESAKRFGGMLRSQEIEAITNLVLARSDDAAVGENAASLMGSLGLPNDRILRLVFDAQPAPDRVTSTDR